ncbi:MAG: hypothetical protein JW919_05095 [Candidatus Omnitrophica bacterium]|nr:hypothetical protein [Candidatus Omnitrophota bacterium]
MRTEKNILYAMLLMGFTSLVVQTLLIREFLITFYGNELTIGLILANWIILEAIGSGVASRFAGRLRHPAAGYSLLQIGISLYLPASLFLIRNIRNLLGLSVGEGTGLFYIMAGSFIILAPLSIFDGAQFPLGCRLLSDSSEKPLESTGRVYILEALGFILAGPVFTYILIGHCSSFNIAFFLGSLNLVSAILLLRKRLNGFLARAAFGSCLILIAATVTAFFGPSDAAQKASLRGQWKGQELLDYRNSIYGNLAVTRSGEQLTFYSDGIPLITAPTPNRMFIEDFVHFGMLAHPDPKEVLVIGGGPGGVLEEILKYREARVTYVELDPLLIELLRSYPSALTKDELGSARVRIEYGDGRRFVKLTKSVFDVVLMNLPAPSTLQINRFYTREFFRSVESILKEGGELCLSLPGSSSYLSEEMGKLNGSILKTLASIFNVGAIPGDDTFYIAAKGRQPVLDAGLFGRRLEERGVDTDIITAPYLDYRLGAYWKGWFAESLGNMAKVRENLDLLPSATFYAVSYWNALFSRGAEKLFRLFDALEAGPLFAWTAVAGLLLLALHAFSAKRRGPAMAFAIGTTGFAGMCLNLMFIYAFQSFYGFVFHYLAMLTTSFMAGLTAGGIIANRTVTKGRPVMPLFIAAEAALLGFCLLAGPAMSLLNKTIAETALSAAFLLLLGITGFLVGLEFPLGTRALAGIDAASSPRTGGVLYALDLAGSWIAALIVSVVLVPVIGVMNTCVFLAIIKAASLAIVLMVKRS